MVYRWVSGDRDGRIHVWSTDAAHRCVTELQSPHKENVFIACIHWPESAGGCIEGGFGVFDLESTSYIERHDNLGWLCDFSVAPDKKLAASLSEEGDLTV